MILDALLTFTGTINGAAGGITDGRFTDAPTTGTQVASNVIDLGLDDGIPTSANGGGARDIGAASENVPLHLQCAVTEAFADGTSLQLQLQGAPDDGNGAEGSYTTMWTGEAVVEADLDIGAQLANVDVPRVVAGQPMPRFLRLRFITVGIHTAGAVHAGIVLNKLDQPQGDTNALSGYPAGLNVAN